MRISSPSFPVIIPSHVGVIVSTVKLPPAPNLSLITPLMFLYSTKDPSCKNTLNCDSSLNPLVAPLISNSPNVSNRSELSIMSNTSTKNSTSNSSISNSLNSSRVSSSNSSSSNSVNSKNLHLIGLDLHSCRQPFLLLSSPLLLQEVIQ